MHRPASTLKIALAQLNPTVGDVAGNAAKVREARAEAAGLGADLVMFPELFLAGYPPEDLVLKPAFQDACREACEALARETGDGGPAVLVGLPWVEERPSTTPMRCSTAARIAALRFKVDLPNYGVFDEKRVFAPGPLPGPVVIRGVRIGIPVCEDIWGDDVVECLAETGGEILLVPNGSPYWRGKTDERFNIAAARVTESGLPLVYLNQIGGQDELVFDGASFVLNADARSPARCRPSARRWRSPSGRRREEGWRCAEAPQRDVVEEGDEADYAACVLGLRDYVDKNRFPGVVLGLSGRHRLGALRRDGGRCARRRARALRDAALPLHLERVASDAADCAEALGVRYDIVPIAGRSRASRRR